MHKRGLLHGARAFADSADMDPHIVFLQGAAAMETFMVERSLKGISTKDLGAAQLTAIKTASEMSRNGTPILYLRSTFVPETGACMCLFKAESEQSVKTLNEKAKLPFERIVKAMDLTP